MRAVMTLFLFIPAGSWFTGCTSDRCRTDNDCFVPEVCVERRCTIPIEEIAVQDAGLLVMDAGTDAAHATADVSPPTITDLGLLDSGRDVALDHGEDLQQMDGGRPESCVIDPFSFECEDDDNEPNNVQFDGTRLAEETYGCPVTGFKPFSGEIEGTLCPIDGADWYRLNFVDCDDGPLIMEFQLELLSACDPNVVGLRTPQFDCADELVQCTIEDGKPTLRAIVERTDTPVFRTAYVEVHNKMTQDVTFDYRLSVELRR